MIDSFKWFTCLLLVILASLHVRAAEQEQVRFDRISVEDGLSQGSIYFIMQDCQGFMWFGTQDGLNRYDGYGFKIFRHIPGDPTSLSSNIIVNIYEDSRGVLWVGTKDGVINQLDRDTETFTRHQGTEKGEMISKEGLSLDIREDGEGRLWVFANATIRRFDREAGKFIDYERDPEDKFHYATPAHFLLDKSGTFWLGYGNSVYRYQKESDSFKLYPLINPTDSKKDILGMILETDSRGLLIGCMNSYHVYDKENDKFIPSDEHPLAFLGDLQSRVTAGMEAGNGILWFGIMEYGVVRYDPETEEITRFSSDPNDPFSISQNIIMTIYEDRSGVLWFGTAYRGLNKLDLEKVKFNLYRNNPNDKNSLSNDHVWSLFLDSQDVLWIGTIDGLDAFDRSTGIFTHYKSDKNDPKGLRGNSVQAIYEDRYGTIWVGTAGGGLNAFDREKGEFTHYISSKDDPETLSTNFITSILEDSSGELWVGTGHGLNRFDRQTGSFERYFHNDDDPDSLSNNSIKVIFEDHTDTLWIATWSEGLDRMNREEGTFTHFRNVPDDPQSLPNNYIHAIYEDPKHFGDDLWIGTYGHGFSRFNRSEGTFTHYTSEEGLPNDVIYGILGDENGHLWISMNDGLTRFNPVTGTFRTFDVTDGLQSNEFNSGAFHKSSTGELFFGGIRGVNSFYPEKIRENRIPPEVVFTDFKMFNKSVAISKDSPLHHCISSTDKLMLRHDQNVLSFEFVGLHYSSPEKNTYAYMMEGFDKEWNYVGARRYAIYTGLPHGKYTFKVKAANGDGVWNEMGKSIKLRILPPWWKTWWAYIFYFFFVFGSIFGAVRFEKNRERQKAIMTEIELRSQAAELQSKVADAQARVLQTEVDIKQRELSDARDLQLSMLPESVPESPYFDIAVSLETATEVGGDYYDFHTSEEGVLTVALGDATGHGTKAGFMVAIMKGLFSTLCSESSIQSFLKQCNRIIYNMQLEQMWMAMMLLKIKEHSIRVSTAAMPRLLVYRARQKVAEEILMEGMFLGVEFDVPHKEIEIGIEPGDTVLLMSDGFPELLNEKDELLDYERVRGHFEEVADKSPEEIISHLQMVAKKWRGETPQSDDITFIVLKAKSA